MESFNAELETMLEMTGCSNDGAMTEEMKGDEDDDIFFECATTSVNLGNAAAPEEC